MTLNLKFVKLLIENTCVFIVTELHLLNILLLSIIICNDLNCSKSYIK